MANGTAGLGQASTVFDFSGIAQLGLQIDQINEAKAEKKSAKFQAGNKDLQEATSLAGIRDVDRPYLQSKLNEFQDLSAKAYRTEDPAIAKQARDLRAQISERVAVSSTLQKNDFAESGKFAETEDFDYYKNQLESHRQTTAMTADNDGLIDPVAVKYTFIPEKDLIKGTLVDAVNPYLSAVKETATGTADGVTKTSPAQVKKLANEKYDAFSTTNEGKLLVKESFFMNKFDIKRFKESDVKRMEEMLSTSEQLQSQFDNEQQIEEAYKNDPAKMREAKSLFNLKKEMDDYGRKTFVTEIEARTGLADRTTKTEEGPSEYDKLKGQMALSSGGNLSDAVTNFEVSESTVPEGFDTDQPVGYASVPNMGLKASTKGDLNKVFQGVVYAENGKEYAIIAEPSDNFLEEIQALKKAGLEDEEYQARAMELLSKDNYQTRMVPISQARSFVQSNYLNASRVAAKEEYSAMFSAAASAI